MILLVVDNLVLDNLVVDNLVVDNTFVALGNGATHIQYLPSPVLIVLL
ncbi:MAG: hypothetical protein F6J94_08050 [Moorea sp. SIO1F2]|nr:MULTISPECIES: hypothetical protein [unclassified Moorena]NEO62573.1 hypothetical protein [Moorena sp. SIO4G2]NEO22851.1 hypothetical protein [Moorena sp. SIO4A5]NEP25832.1 hypothetical protein [Moorena sp. SIO3I6]NEQ61508.1 hypothetical protein [Moorena sp. SIO4A1]NET81894.1 hypothetical protein [Moorena sp. SIO1F2]